MCVKMQVAKRIERSRYEIEIDRHHPALAN